MAADDDIYEKSESSDTFVLTKFMEWKYKEIPYEYWRVERRNKYLSHGYHFPRSLDLVELQKKAMSGVQVIVEARCGSAWLEGKFDVIPGVIVIADMARVMMRDGKKWGIKRCEDDRRIIGRGPWEEEKFMVACNIFQIIGRNEADYRFVEGLLEREIGEFYRAKPVERKEESVGYGSDEEGSSRPGSFGG